MIETEFEKWCKREGYNVTSEYDDDYIEGITLGRRQGWKAALKWVLEEGYTDPENDFIYILKSKLEKELDV